MSGTVGSLSEYIISLITGASGTPLKSSRMTGLERGVITIFFSMQLQPHIFHITIL